MRLARDPKNPAAKRGREGADVFAIDLEERETVAGGEETGISGEVAAVSQEGVAREAALDRQVREVLPDRLLDLHPPILTPPGESPAHGLENPRAACPDQGSPWDIVTLVDPRPARSYR